MEKFRVTCNHESTILDVRFDDVEKKFIYKETAGEVRLKKEKGQSVENKYVQCHKFGNIFINHPSAAYLYCTGYGYDS